MDGLNGAFNLIECDIRLQADVHLVYSFCIFSISSLLIEKFSSLTNKISINVYEYLNK